MVYRPLFSTTLQSTLVRRIAIAAVLVLCAALGPAAAGPPGPVTGWVDGVLGSTGAQYIQGWACEPGNANALTIHLYTGGPVGSGQLYGAYTASASPADPGVSPVCGNTNGHRFLIPVSGDLLERAGQSIYVYGIAQSGGSNNLLSGSGGAKLPAPTTHAVFDGVDAHGLAWGWAFDATDSAESLQVQIFADGEPARGAATGTLVWSGPTTTARPDVNGAYGIAGVHGFSASLPAWVTSGVHSLSAYAVARGGALVPMTGSPQIPGASTVQSRFSFTTSATGFPSLWMGYQLPASKNAMAALRGTISLTHSTNRYAEILFLVGYLPSGACPTAGTTAQWGPPGTTPLWTNIVKAPAAGTFGDAVHFTLPATLPLGSCVLVGINGGPVAAGHPVTGSVDLTVTYLPGQDATGESIDLGSEFCFGQSWGCQGATTDNSLSFASVVPVTRRSRLLAAWGNISDSTFDGSGSFGAPPRGPFTATNDVYVYHGASCSPLHAGANGPGDYTGHIPADAVQLLSAPLSGGAGVQAVQTIDPLLPGWSNGIPLYRNFSGITLNPGDCVVSLYGIKGSSAGFDNENQLHLIVQPD